MDTIKKILHAIQRYYLYPVYLLQLENYNQPRFIKGSIGHIVRRPLVWRQTIQWTDKLILISAIAVLPLLIIAGVLSAWHWLLGLIAFAVLAQCFSIFLLGALWFTLPIDQTLKAKLITRARTKILAHPNLTVIGIAGSYGKTTMKEALFTVLKTRQNVLATPDSINTPIGIARLILDKLIPETKIFVVEMGEFIPGDIAEICSMVTPDIAVLTGINEAHLERMGDIHATIGTIFELALGTKPNGTIILNADDANIVENYQKFLGGHTRTVLFYSNTNTPTASIAVSDYMFDPAGPGQTFTLRAPEIFTNTTTTEATTDSISEAEQQYSFGTPKDQSPTQQTKQFTASLPGELTITTKLLGSYIVGVCSAAALVAKKCNIPESLIASSLSTMEPVPHRLQPIQNANGVLILDDSYNGNPQGVAAAIDVLGKFTDRRKIFLTPGLVETGSQTQTVHEQIGKQLAAVCDIVLLIQTNVTKYIFDGLVAGGFTANNVHIFPTTQAAHAALGSILKPGDVIVFQNDWTDNYL